VRARVLVLTFLGLVCSGLAAGSSCGVYDITLLLGADAGPDAGDSGTKPDAGICPHARWPERPTADDPSTGDIQPFYNAVSSLDFGVRTDGGAPPPLGFDLDGFCTCQGEPESCHQPEGGQPHCDLEAGVDNQGLALVRQFSAFPGFFEQDYINGRVQNGYWGALIRVAKYNGKPNDTQVEVAFFPSNGTKGIEQGFPTQPVYDGKDQWTIDPSAVLGGSIPDGGDPAPKYVDQSAYVSNGVLVANLGFPILVGASAGDNTLTIDLTGAIVAAKLVPSMGSYKVDEGMIAGRWTTTKMLTSLQVLHDPFTMGEQLCGMNGTYQLIKGKICQSADIAANVIEDGKNAPCGALSVGIAFTSSPALPSGTFPRPDAGSPCGLQWVDSCMQ
jgi:hypothetical protein